MTQTPATRELWLGVELRHLAALAAIASEGSFRGAAARLGYVQSAVSQQISFLERSMGARLVDRSRGPNPVTLTEAGELLLAHADTILARLRAARADLETLAGADELRLRIGMAPSVTRRVLGSVLSELAADRPDVEPTPVEVACERERLALLERGELDVAFVDLPVPHGPFEAMELLADPYMLVVPENDGLAELTREPRLEEIVERRLLGRSSERIAGSRPSDGGDPEQALADSAVQALVAAGQGAAVLPRLALDGQRGTVALDIGELLPPRMLGLCWHRDRRAPEALDALRRAAERICADGTLVG